ncbi:type VI secretion system ImpA family N-terminal domain-containing protein [Lelliottia amnigena]|uniref:Type VI secretion system ImpA family N-terminal domain-containing protein n=2 Tax=Enterobacteriaceae TaxID=543 RepID=A0AAP2AE89_LELAM|nr:type VI secretion system ImpA family N-terminal domain-containing protein [Lelliottia amnigena]MBL5935238.1 type VI secretion system ImpA family N-terminal domain-containing protein [Lelliottia amnigena]
MNNMTPRKIKTGGDPRALPDYAALRDELSKLTHPARPDVNWRYAEKLCLSLFEQNGVELQTAAWYTLARMQLAGLSGLNEGLAILEALISHQWGTLWPQPVHARMEILSSLSLRLQQRMRTLALNYGDLSQLYRAEQLLGRLGTVLQRLELKHLSQLDVLRTLMHNSAVRLENSDGTGANIQPGIVLPSTMMNGSTASTRDLAGGPDDDFRVPDSAVKWVYVAQPEQQPNVDVLATMPAPVKKWKSFAGGMCTMLLISSAAAFVWQSLHRSDPLQIQFAASLAPLPAVLTPEQLAILQQRSSLPAQVIAQTQQQLARLEKLPPDWNIAYGRKLAEQARTLWPEQAKPLVQQWEQQLSSALLPAEQLNGWHQGMTILQKLSDRLNGLDEQKGKYMTVSELKSQVFAATQAFGKTVPVEEQLRQMSIPGLSQTIPAAQKMQTELHLKQLITRYSAVTERQ